MSLAGLSPAGALIVRSGEPFAVQTVLRAAPSGDPQSMVGRSFVLSLRASSQVSPFLTLPYELASDGLSASAMGTRGHATTIYEMGVRASVSYDIVEITNGSSTTRWTGRVAVAPGPEFPSDIVPMIADLPVSEVLLMPTTIVVSERGAQGFGAEKRLYDAGVIDAPTVPSLIDWLKALVAQAVAAVADLLLGPDGLAIPRNLQSLTRVTGVDPSADLILGVGGDAYVINAALFGSQFGGEGSVPTYVHYVEGIVATDTAQTILPGDDNRRAIIMQAEEADLAINWNGGQASFDDPDSWIQSAGQPWSWDDVGREAISVVARWVDTDRSDPVLAPLKIRLHRTAAAPPPSDTTADAIMAAWPDPVDARLRVAVREQIAGLVESGIWAKVRFLGWFMGATAANNRVNWADPDGPLMNYVDGSTGITTVPYGHVQGGGTNAYISTGLSFDALGMTLDSHMMAASTPSADIAGTTANIMGCSVNFMLNPNRTLTQAGYRTGSGTDLQAATPGGSIGLSRVSALEYMQFEEANLLATVARQLTATPSNPLNLLATNGSGGYGAVTTLPLRWAVAGPGLTPTEYAALINALKAIELVCNQIRES